jgi:hypothetical protein
LLDELARLRLFVVEIRDFDAMLVPAVSVSARPEPAKVKDVTVGGKLSPDLAAQFRDAAARAGTTVSALIAQFAADYVAAQDLPKDLPVYNTTRGPVVGQNIDRGHFDFLKNQ